MGYELTTYDLKVTLPSFVFLLCTLIDTYAY